MRRFGFLPILVAALAAFALASPAFAEGSWSGYFSDVGVGFDSRKWTDRNSDSTSTSIRIAQCRVRGPYWRNGQPDPSNQYIRVQLTRDSTPDQNKGQKNYLCPAGSTQYYGDQTAGDFWFTVVLLAGDDCCYRGWSSDVRVGY